MDDGLKVAPLTGATQVKAASLVIRQCWQESYQGILPAEQLQELDEHIWQHSLTRPGRVNLVAVDNGRIVGLVSYGAPRQAGYFTEGQGELMSIYVLADHQKRGIGTALMKAALDGLKQQGFDHAALWVMSTNAQAIAFYERAGWQGTGVQQKQAVLGQKITLVQYQRAL